MRFNLTEEQGLIQQAAEAFARDHGSSGQVRAAMASPLGFDEKTWASLGEIGFPVTLLPTNVGGQGLGAVEMALVFEALGAKLLPSPLLATGVLSASVLASLQHSMAREVAALIASSNRRGAVARIENRSARFVLDAHIADYLLIEQDGRCRLIEAQAPGEFAGVRVTRLKMMDQSRVLSHLELDHECAAKSEVLAEGDSVTRAFDHAFDMGRLAIAAEAVGAAQECLTRTVEYVQQRVQFGRAIGSFQAVKHQLADMMVGVEAARSAVYYAAASANDHPLRLPAMAALAKLEASEALTHAAGRMIQLHGGIGFTWEHDAHLYFKRARGTETLFGTNAALDERIARHIGLDDAA